MKIELTDGEALRLAAERLALAKVDVPIDENEEEILAWLTRPDPDQTLAVRVELIEEARADLDRALVFLRAVRDDQPFGDDAEAPDAIATTSPTRPFKRGDRVRCQDPVNDWDFTGILVAQANDGWCFGSHPGVWPEDFLTHDDDSGYQKASENASVPGNRVEGDKLETPGGESE